MNELQKAEFEILKCVIDVCDTLGLTCYMVCGSALGCIKYHGFIPWDDDIDVAMPREDYETFCQKAPELLPTGLFVQTAETDKNFPQIYCKVRNSATTYIEESVKHLDIHHGIYIDVFPLDAYPRGAFRQKRFEWIKAWNMLVLSGVIGASAETKPITKLLFGFIRFFGLDRNTAKRIKRFSGIIRSYSDNESGILCNHGNWQGKKEYAPYSQYAGGTSAEFEGLRVRVPADTDAYLTQKYGDWRADLPEDQKKGSHRAAVIDVNRPYTDYLERTSDGVVRLTER